jgi:hypothetical protein
VPRAGRTAICVLASQRVVEIELLLGVLQERQRLL